MLDPFGSSQVGTYFSLLTSPRTHTFVECDTESIKLTGIIDWGDALLGTLLLRLLLTLVGSPFFDLAVIHIDQFFGDKKLLKNFLEGYAEASQKDGNTSIYERPDFVYRCMANLLLFPYNQFLNKKKQTGIFCEFPDLWHAENFGLIATALFDLSS
jgi:hypothetical protein